MAPVESSFGLGVRIAAWVRHLQGLVDEQVTHRNRQAGYSAHSSSLKGNAAIAHGAWKSCRSDYFELRTTGRHLPIRKRRMAPAFVVLRAVARRYSVDFRFRQNSIRVTLTISP